uniref:Myb-like domain-containing protein n=1 Tax=Brassica oleracea var. oleracea TaxID=109376 RepID=A0A0D3C5Q5_BRAOL
MANTSGYVNLLTSQIPIDIESPEANWFDSQVPDKSGVKERRKWSPTEDKILIGAWLNTSKDPVVSTEQEADAFWNRIVDYYNASPLLVVSSCGSYEFYCFEQTMPRDHTGEQRGKFMECEFAIYRIRRQVIHHKRLEKVLSR